MPYITEGIWEQLSKIAGLNPSIIAAGWPTERHDPPMQFRGEGSEEVPVGGGCKADRVSFEMNTVQSIITAVRVVRSEMNLAPATMINVVMSIPDPARRGIVQANIADIKRLAKIEQAAIHANVPRPPQSSVAVVAGVDIYIPLSGLIDLEKEKQRLAKELAFTNNEIERCNKNLANDGFVKRAPASEVEKIRVRLHQAKEKVERLKSNLESLK